MIRDLPTTNYSQLLYSAASVTAHGLQLELHLLKLAHIGGLRLSSVEFDRF